jgi:hypothetical protein
MMMVNGATSPDAIVWEQTVSVSPNSEYGLSFWFSNWQTATHNPANIECFINNTLLGSCVQPDVNGVWFEFSRTWQSGFNTTATIKIVDTQTAISTNDFAIDDISLVPKPAIEALVDINPDSLNKNSKGLWVTVYITLPAGYDVSKIVANSIVITSLAGTSCPPDYNQPIDLNFTPQIGDRDEDGIPDLTVKFDRQQLLANLCLDDVSVTIEGNLVTGQKFKGTDRIRVLDRGK